MFRAQVCRIQKSSDLLDRELPLPPRSALPQRLSTFSRGCPNLAYRVCQVQSLACTSHPAAVLRVGTALRQNLLCRRPRTRCVLPDHERASRCRASSLGAPSICVKASVNRDGVFFAMEKEMPDDSWCAQPVSSDELQPCEVRWSGLPDCDLRPVVREARQPRSHTVTRFCPPRSRSSWSNDALRQVAPSGDLVRRRPAVRVVSQLLT